MIIGKKESRHARGSQKQGRRTSRTHAGSQGKHKAGTWKSFWRLNWRMGSDALKRLALTPVASLMTIMVLGVALALPASFSVMLANLKMAAGGENIASARVSLYLDSGIDDKQALRLCADLMRDTAIQSAVYISPSKGLADFEEYSGLGEALRLLENNPLPGVIEVEPKDTSPLAIDSLKNRLKRTGGVVEVRVDSAWLKRLDAMLELGERVLIGLSLLICAAVLLIIGNTIRLLVVSRSDEIRVIKLVGGSDAFVILPFLYSGLWYGLAGGVLCWLIISSLWFMVSGPATELAVLYQSSFRPGPPDSTTSLLLIGGGALMGILGAWLASWRQLRQIAP